MGSPCADLSLRASLVRVMALAVGSGQGERAGVGPWSPVGPRATGAATAAEGSAHVPHSPPACTCLPPRPGPRSHGEEEEAAGAGGDQRGRCRGGHGPRGGAGAARGAAVGAPWGPPGGALLPPARTAVPRPAVPRVPRARVTPLPCAAVTPVSCATVTLLPHSTGTRVPHAPPLTRATVTPVPRTAVTHDIPVALCPPCSLCPPFTPLCLLSPLVSHHIPLCPLVPFFLPVFPCLFPCSLFRHVPLCLTMSHLSLWGHVPPRPAGQPSPSHPQALGGLPHGSPQDWPGVVTGLNGDSSMFTREHGRAAQPQRAPDGCSPPQPAPVPGWGMRGLDPEGLGLQLSKDSGGQNSPRLWLAGAPGADTPVLRVPITGRAHPCWPRCPWQREVVAPGRV